MMVRMPALAAFANGRGHLGPGRVDHAGQADEDQVFARLPRASLRRAASADAVGQAEDAQGVAGHGLVGREDARRAPSSVSGALSSTRW